ncbi:MAG: Glycosyltransferase [Parcubacteria group bacterium GW2011_GWC2_42_12]|uniref:Glycosyltransferase 2-like domain-containing protein n=1 Tax=Candidatus Falkowbacteria bacterium RIFCSPHIGHO2_02_FULL_42_9 TaxID=1797986 RepID=A0A1F5SA78_9BACT|nr:MAG: Glycosyltransferase [Parcubacteria group bacterium GW2011_GWC2_42_12]OGF23472.1 MAG: hypothetical protein A3D45_01100 [Candidatus Falkowbacteria bacterium RIFCSPHIGHO2_02_FULL_42_9]
MENKYSLSLVIPAFNEEELLAGIIRESAVELSKVSDDFEIILVNDGSTDRTGQIAQKLAEEFKFLKIVNLEKNRGVGEATIAGLLAAQKEIIFNNTVDAFFNIKELPRFLPYFASYDIVSGYRTNLKSNSIYGKILTIGNFRLIKFLFPRPKLRAYQTVQFIKNEVIKKIKIEAETTFIAPEILIKADHFGYKIKELGTEYQKRKAGEGKCGKPKFVIRSFYDILRCWFKWKILDKWE